MVKWGKLRTLLWTHSSHDLLYSAITKVFTMSFICRAIAHHTHDGQLTTIPCQWSYMIYVLNMVTISPLSDEWLTLIIIKITCICSATYCIWYKICTPLYPTQQYSPFLKSLNLCSSFSQRLICMPSLWSQLSTIPIFYGDYSILKGILGRVLRSVRTERKEGEA